MNCENLQFNLSIYLDDILTDEERACLDEHLSACPLCRQKLSEFQAVRRDLRMMQRPVLSEKVLNSVRNAVAENLTVQPPKEKIADKLSAWASVYLMPYSVGTVGSLLFGFLILWGLATANTGTKDDLAYGDSQTTSIMLANAAPGTANNFAMDPVDFANERISIPAISPSVNPRGPLVALTKSFVRGEIKDDEVVVVADVFGDGLAQIAEVVEPSGNREAVRDLERALKTNPEYAPPFLPAKMDNRSNTVRVVLKFQTVEVDTEKTPN